MAPSPSNLEDRLNNWGRAMRVSRGRGRALSFEGNYRSPQRNHWELPVSSLHRSIDTHDAWKIETAWGSLPIVERIVLRGHYCLKWPTQRIFRVAAKENGILRDSHNLEGMLSEARFMLAQALGRSDGQNRNILRAGVRKLLDMVGLAGYKTI